MSISEGALSTSSLASLSPKLVKPLTSLITCIFCDPAPARTTSKESFSAPAPASSPPPAGAAATATGAAAVTSNFSSKASKNSFYSNTVISSNTPSNSSVVILAICYSSSFLTSSEIATSSLGEATSETSSIDIFLSTNALKA